MQPGGSTSSFPVHPSLPSYGHRDDTPSRFHLPQPPSSHLSMHPQGGRDLSPYPQQPHSPSGYAHATSGDENSGQFNSTVQTLKSRSVMACQLCRRQKMKCEGPEKAPCRRCRAAGVDCIFEAPTVTAPRPRVQGHATEAWVESRLQPFDARLSDLENHASSGSLARIDGPSQHSILSEHERRISQLEAQLYALQFSGASHSLSLPVAPHLDPHAPYHHNNVFHPPTLPSVYGSGPPYPFPHHLTGGGGYGQPPSPAASRSFGGPTHSYGSQTSEYRSPGPPQSREHSSSSSRDPPGGSGSRPPPSFKREAGSESGGESSPVLNGSGRPDKRWRGTLSDGDYVSRGAISEDEAVACFDAYFFSLDHRAQGPDGHTSIQLPFAETRKLAPLLFATIIFIGARSLARHSVAMASLDEALSLCHCTFLSDDEPTALDFRAIVLLGLYTGLQSLVGHATAISHRLDMVSALLEYDLLPEEEKASERGAILVSRGRTFLVSWLFVSYYTFVRNVSGGYDVPEEVLIRQLDILDASEHTRPSTDKTIRGTLMECLILKRAFDRLGPGRRLILSSYASPEAFAEASIVVEAGVTELLAWSKDHLEVMENLTVWGDSTELKTAIPFHHGRLRLLTYIFEATPNSRDSLELPRIRDFARMARESALVLLRWGLESRIWLPHSMIAQYLHHVNIPSAVHLLYRSSRLFPADTNFGLVRTLLHRLLRQCDNLISANAGTNAEVARARQTRDLALEFDRFAFDEYGDAEAPLNEPDVFNDELAGSLGALGQEVNLFGSVLIGALEGL